MWEVWKQQVWYDEHGNEKLVEFAQFMRNVREWLTSEYLQTFSATVHEDTWPVVRFKLWRLAKAYSGPLDQHGTEIDFTRFLHDDLIHARNNDFSATHEAARYNEREPMNNGVLIVLAADPQRPGPIADAQYQVLRIAPKVQSYVKLSDDPDEEAMVLGRNHSSLAWDGSRYVKGIFAGTLYYQDMSAYPSALCDGWAWVLTNYTGHFQTPPGFLFKVVNKIRHELRKAHGADRADMLLRRIVVKAPQDDNQTFEFVNAQRFFMRCARSQHRSTFLNARQRVERTLSLRQKDDALSPH